VNLLIKQFDFTQRNFKMNYFEMEETENLSIESLARDLPRQDLLSCYLLGVTSLCTRFGNESILPNGEFVPNLNSLSAGYCLSVYSLAKELVNNLHLMGEVIFYLQDEDVILFGTSRDHEVASYLKRYPHIFLENRPADIVEWHGDKSMLQIRKASISQKLKYCWNILIS
jgi:hypothetical protein